MKMLVGLLLFSFMFSCAKKNKEEEEKQPISKHGTVDTLTKIELKGNTTKDILSVEERAKLQESTSEKLKQELLSSLPQVIDNNEKIDRLKKEKERLEDKLRTDEVELAKIQAQKELLKNKRLNRSKHLKKQLSKKKEQLTPLKNKITPLEAKRASLTQKKQELSKKISFFDSDIKNNSEKISLLKEKIEKLNKHKENNLSFYIDGSVAYLRQDNYKLSKLQKANTKDKKERKKLEDTLEEIQQEFNQYDSNIKLIKRKLGRLQNKIAKIKEEMSELSNQEGNEKSQERSNPLVTYKQKISKLDKQINDLYSEQISSQDNYNKSKLAIQDKLNRLLDDQELEKAILSKKDELHKLIQKLLKSTIAKKVSNKELAYTLFKYNVLKQEITKKNFFTAEETEKAWKDLQEIANNIKSNFSKTQYEKEIMNRTGVTDIKYNMSKKYIMNVLNQSKLQCFSGTNLYAIMALLTNHNVKNGVMIYTQNHIQPGYISDDNLIAIETVAAGEAKINYGKINQVEGEITVVDLKQAIIFNILEPILNNTAKTLHSMLIYAQNFIAIKMKDMHQYGEKIENHTSISFDKMINSDLLSFGLSLEETDEDSERPSFNEKKNESFKKGRKKESSLSIRKQEKLEMKEAIVLSFSSKHEDRVDNFPFGNDVLEINLMQQLNSISRKLKSEEDFYNTGERIFLEAKAYKTCHVENYNEENFKYLLSTIISQTQIIQQGRSRNLHFREVGRPLYFSPKINGSSENKEGKLQPQIVFSSSINGIGNYSFDTEIKIPQEASSILQSLPNCIQFEFIFYRK